MISRTIIFAGGGTAGHVEPALAVAKSWKLLHPQDQEIFLGTIQGLENSLVPEAGFPLLNIPKVELPRKMTFRLLSLPFNLIKAVATVRKGIAGSNLLIGFGGYVCAPAYLAARLEKIPIVIHEANSKVGWANRLGSLFSHNLATAHRIERGSFATARITGLPLRSSILKSVEAASQDWEMARRLAKEELGWSADLPTLLVIGGSQGSAFINKEIAGALDWLASRGAQVHHSVGRKNALPHGNQRYLPVAYIKDMANAYLAADIVIARSGAVTCSEFGALGRYGIFIPLPIGNGEQSLNANFLVCAPRARVILQQEFSASWLIDNFDNIYSASKATPLGGLPDDLRAVEAILALMEDCLKENTR